jgi:hypothetical protein
MLHRGSASVILLLSATLVGCISNARRLDVPSVAKIKVGATTTAEVEEMFGRPSETMIGPNERAVARYYFREFRAANDVRAYERHEHPGDILFRTLTLRYGPERIVEQKLHDESVTPIHRLNEWFSAGPTLLPENMNFMRKGATIKAEVIDRLGEPTSQTLDAQGLPVLIWVGGRVRRDRLANAEVRQLIVLLDERAVVKDYAILLQDVPGVRGNWR